MAKTASTDAPPERKLTFDDMLGHEQAREYLRRAVREGQLPQALLITGAGGIGKTTLAWSLAKEIVCGGEDPAGHRAAGKVERGTHPDVLTNESGSGASGQITVDWIREELEPKLYRSPLESPKKVVIISPADRMNTFSANLLLKVLEEPPRDLHMILLTADPVGILPTIRSRCTPLPLEGVPLEQLVPWLTRRGAGESQAALAAKLAEGRLGLALSLLQGSALGRRKAVLAELMHLQRQGFAAVFGVADRLAALDANLTATLGAAVMLLRDILAISLGAGPVINLDIEGDLREAAAGISPEGALEAAALFERAAGDMADLYSAAAKNHFMETLMIGVGRELKRN